MGYQAVYMVEYGYHDDPFRYINSDDTGLIVFDPWDGVHIHRYFADGIHLYKRPQRGEPAYEVLYYEHTPVEFVVTDSRVMLRIERFLECRHEDDTMAAVESERHWNIPAYRRDEMVLMGMIRYEWLSQVSYRSKTGFMTNETVRLYYKDEQRALWHLDIVFRREADAGFIANEILRRACAYRLAMTDEKDDKELYFFNEYLHNRWIDPSPDPKKMSTVGLPTQYPAPGGQKYRPPLVNGW